MQRLRYLILVLPLLSGCSLYEFRDPSHGTAKVVYDRSMEPSKTSAEESNTEQQSETSHDEISEPG